MELGARANAQQVPDSTAVVFGAVRHTWREWNARMCQLAHALAGLGLTPGDKVAVLLHNRPEVLEIAQAAAKAGVVMVPLNYRLRGEEIRYIVEDSDARALFLGPEFLDELRTVLPRCTGLVARGVVVVGADGADGSTSGLTRYEDLLAPQPTDEPEPVADVGQSWMIYTSGTTGRPKGVQRAAGRDPRLLLGIIRGFGLQPGEIHLVPAPLYHSAPTLGAALTIALGGTLVIMARFDAEEFLRLVEAEGVTSSFVVPTMVKRVLALPAETASRYDTSSLRSLIVGAAPFPTETKRAAVDRFGPCIYEYYGSTDAGLNTILPPDEQLRRPTSCGRAVDGNHIRILDDAGREVPRGVVGNIYVTSALTRATRYYKDPEKTTGAFRGDYMTVGDLGYLDAEDYLHVVDRKADMVISGGVNIYPVEVEEVLHGHPAVLDAAVIGVPDDEWGEALKALVQLKPGALATADELLERCREHLADYKRPRTLEFVEEIPRNPSGKILKRELRAPYWEGRRRQV